MRGAFGIAVHILKLLLYFFSVKLCIAALLYAEHHYSKINQKSTPVKLNLNILLFYTIDFKRTKFFEDLAFLLVISFSAKNYYYLNCIY